MQVRFFNVAVAIAETGLVTVAVSVAKANHV